jgi:hypothetical protein
MANRNPHYSRRKSYFVENIRDGKKRVSHVIGSSIHVKTGGWLRFWKNMTRDIFDFDGTCAFENCDQKAEVGAHVQKTASIIYTASWYIVPSCKPCNNMDRKGEYKLNWLRNIQGVTSTLKDEYYEDDMTHIDTRVVVKIVNGGVRNEIIHGHIDSDRLLKILNRPDVDKGQRKRILQVSKW